MTGRRTVSRPVRGLDYASPRALSLVAEVHGFLALEACLLDERQYADWLTLFTDDCLYWMPVDPSSPDGADRLNVIYDDQARLRDRVARLTSGSAFTEDPPTRTARTLSSALVEVDRGEGGDRLQVHNAFTLVAQRRGDQRVLAGRYTHRLVRQDGDLRIAEKRVGLLGSDEPQRPLTFLF